MLKLPVYFTGYNRRKDRSVSLRFETQELSTAQLGEIDALVMEETFGWLAFKENELQPVDIPTQDAEETGKTASARMRGILFIEWTQKGKVGTFDGYYRQRMDELCDKLKAQLD
jgi:hypothetical protein